ncbi:MAG: glycosyltransferase [Phycisphaerales bacterium]
MSTPRVVFAGGGTGGHIYPGLAIAEKLLECDPSVTSECLRFVCSTRDIDRAILSNEKLAGTAVDFTPLEARPFGLSPRRALAFAAHWRTSTTDASRLIAGARAVVALGGFVAAPVAWSARRARIPVIMVNLDAVAGLSSRFVARFATRVLTTADAGPPSWPRIPPIVRTAAIAAANAQYCRKKLGLDPDRQTLFITGASLGARSINRGVVAMVEAHRDALADWQIIHQTGKDDEREVREAYERLGVRAHVCALMREMGVAWGAADLAIGRSGAGIVAEVWANRVPAIFVPYPYHKDAHQARNPARLVEVGGAVLVTDLIEPGANAAALWTAVESRLDAGVRASMRENLGKLGPADGARRVARVIADELRR